ncbi:MAG: restriction endonuclease subunit S [Candidatus Pacearchaeota archaeon]
MISQKFKQTEIGKIPTDWEEKKLGNYLKLNYGKSLPETERKFGKVPVFGSNGITGFHNNFLVKGPGIIVGRKGSVGEIKFSKDNFWPIDTTYYLTKEDTELDLTFLYYKLLTLGINKMNSHAAVPGLNREDVYIIDTEFPPLSEQISIAKILSSLDEKIELNNKMNKILEEIGQTIFKKWFIKERKEEWKEGFLGDNILTEILGSGIKEFPEEKIYIATADVNNSDIINYNTKITFDNRPSRANMQPIMNSIWFAKMKDSKKVFLIDESKMFEIKNLIFSTGFTGLKVKPEALYYIWNYINNSSFEDMKDNLSIGTTMQGVNNDLIKKIKIIIPDQEILKKFNNLVKNIYLKISINNQHSQTLSFLRDVLLPKLMSGEIRVK